MSDVEKSSGNKTISPKDGSVIKLRMVQYLVPSLAQEGLSAELMMKEVIESSFQSDLAREPMVLYLL